MGFEIFRVGPGRDQYAFGWWLCQWRRRGLGPAVVVLVLACAEEPLGGTVVCDDRTSCAHVASKCHVRLGKTRVRTRARTPCAVPRRGPTRLHLSGCTLRSRPF